MLNCNTDISGPNGASWLQYLALQLLKEADKRQLCRTALNFAQNPDASQLGLLCSRVYELISGHRLIRFDYNAVFTPCGSF